MAQIRLLDSARMSKLLEDALSWSPTASSLLVSASNGSILAYAFRRDTPSIKVMRTLSTTMTAAYTAASENTLVYEAQSSGTISVIGSVADHVLLAVSGDPPLSAQTASAQLPGNQRTLEEPVDDVHPEDDVSASEDGEAQAGVRHDLESISEELATILRDELRGLKWPEDI